MSERTKEPWYVFSHYGDPEIRTKEGDKLVAALLPSKLQDARRIVSCVNACAGIEDPTNCIASLIRGNEELLKVIKQRDRLLSSIMDVKNNAGNPELVYQITKAAIEAVKK